MRWTAPACWCGVMSSPPWILTLLRKCRRQPQRCAIGRTKICPRRLPNFEKLLIGRALARSSGNRTEAARLLGIHRQLLYTKLKRYGLDVPERRSDAEDC